MRATSINPLIGDSSRSGEMSASIQERYDDLRDDFDKLTSAVAGLRRVIMTEDVCIAADLAWICESFACSVLDRHPKVDLSPCLNLQGGDHDA